MSTPDIPTPPAPDAPLTRRDLVEAFRAAALQAETSDQSPELGELVAALCKARLDFGEVKKDKEGKVRGKTKDGRSYEYGYSYADLAAATAATAHPLASQGLTVFQSFEDQDRDSVVVVTELRHTSDQFKRTRLRMACENTPQKIGGAITYGRRYAYLAILGLAPADDDDGARVEEGLRQRQQHDGPSRGGPAAESGEKPPAPDPGANRVRAATGGAKLEVLRHIYDVDRAAVAAGDIDLVAPRALGPAFGAGKGTDKRPRRDGLKPWLKEDFVGLKRALGIKSITETPARSLGALAEFLSTTSPDILPDPEPPSAPSAPSEGEKAGPVATPQDTAPAEEDPVAAEADQGPLGSLWASTWDKVREFRDAAPPDRISADEVASLAGRSGWAQDKIEAVIQGELGCALLGLPALRQGGKPFSAAIVRALSHFTYDSIPDYAEVTEEPSAAMLPGDWLKKDRETLHGFLLAWHKLGVFAETPPSHMAKKHKIIDFIQARMKDEPPTLVVLKEETP